MIPQPKIGLFFSFAAVVQPAAIIMMPAQRQAGMFTVIEAINYIILLIGSAIAGLGLLAFSPRVIITWIVASNLALLFLCYLLSIKRNDIPVKSSKLPMR